MTNDIVERSTLSKDLIQVAGIIQRIKDVQKKAVFSYLELGDLLTQLKGQVKHGEFMALINHEFHISQSTATSLMKMFAKYGNDTKAIEGLPISIAMEISKDNTPEDVIERIQDDRKKGITPTVREIKQLKKEVLESNENETPLGEMESDGDAPSEDRSVLTGEVESDDGLLVFDDEKSLPTSSSTSTSISTSNNNILDINIAINTILEEMSGLEKSLDTINRDSLDSETKAEWKRFSDKLNSMARKINWIVSTKVESQTKKAVKESITEDEATEIVELLRENIAEATEATVPGVGSSQYNNWVTEVKALARNNPSANMENMRLVMNFVKQSKGKPGDKFPGWSTQILSAGKLREKWNQLIAQAKPKNGVKRSIVVDDGIDWSKPSNGRQI